LELLKSWSIDIPIAPEPMEAAMSHALGRTRLLVDHLTVQEREVLTCLVAGESQKTIALRLGIDEDGARLVRKSLMHKLGAACTADAVREGICAGFG
jgi:two-component system, LuxR family, response regulator FixJ